MKNFKNSGIEWLGEIPEHWEVVKIKHIFNIGRGRVISQEELDENGNFPVYSSQTTNNGILGYIKTYDFDCEQITWTTDGVNAGTIFLRNGKYNCTNVCGILKPRNNENMSFLTYALQNVTPYYKRPDTNGAKIMNNEMANIQIVYPPLKEQEQIANFLDEKCEKIQNFIEKKEKLLSLLQEQKQALIDETITKGLDKNVKLKNSGIEWLGEIPEHWEMVRLANFGIFLKGNGISRQDLIEDGEPAIHYGDIYTKYEISTTALKSRISTETAQNITSIHNGDILFAGSGETKEDIGKNIVYLGKEKAFAGGDVIIFRQKKNNALFLSYALNTKYVKSLKGIDSKGEIIVHIYASNLKDIKIPIPPLKEQEQIANFLDEKCEKIDSLITKIKKQIELIKEYKTTLINEAVCGRMGKL
ncbi:restriction endonuclease subunit S [Campylobacter molothri]|uniref:restriction endonuclease subunit S n=1 Tax=Campylobacter molothri TaxID=1032242 RepID=UPI00301D1211|nr:restriction endonuclease subunit S [Campylobacter sp. W0067]MBZ7961990.1 restriction endonuclease subunit S [Campylobacter sp. W0049]